MTTGVPRLNPDRGVSTSRRYQIPENLPSYPTTQRAGPTKVSKEGAGHCPCTSLDRKTLRNSSPQCPPNNEPSGVDSRAGRPAGASRLARHSNPSFDRRGLSLSMQHWTAAQRLAKCTRLSTRTGNTPGLWRHYLSGSGQTRTVGLAKPPMPAAEKNRDLPRPGRNRSIRLSALRSCPCG